MIKIVLPLIIVFGLISCNNKTLSIDYFGQVPPDNISEIFAKDKISVEGRFEYGISFSPNGNELAFGVLNLEDFTGQIYYSKKANNKWSEPISLNVFRGNSVYLPFFTPDGNHLLFTQDKSKNDIQITDIGILERVDTGWGNLKILPEPVSSYSREGSVNMTLDRTLYFSSNRECQDCLADLYSCKLNKKGKYETAEKIKKLSTIKDEEGIFVSAKDEFVIFRSILFPTKSDADLFISYRDINNEWIKPQVLDSLVNTVFWEQRPFVSFDNQYLFFTRRIDDAEGNMESDIYWVSTKAVFKPYVFNPISDTTLIIGENFKILIPVDYFKDIDDEKLALKVNSDEIDWLQFDKDNLTLSGTPTQEGDFDIFFTAIDKFSNKTEDKIKLSVVE